MTVALRVTSRLRRHMRPAPFGPRRRAISSSARVCLGLYSDDRCCAPDGRSCFLGSPSELRLGAGGARTREQRITKPAILTATVHAGNCLCGTVFDWLVALVGTRQFRVNPDHSRNSSISRPC
jgi:hypothetical protein